MELFEYLRFRWKYLLPLLLAGLVGVAAVGSLVPKGDYVATSQMLVRPPASLTSSYAGDPDRYINTEMTFLFTESSLRRVADDAGTTPGVVGRSLSFSHASGSDIVTLKAAMADAPAAVAVVNAAADAYLASVEQRQTEPIARQQARLADQIDRAQKELTKTSAALRRATAEYRAQNPDGGIPAPAVVAPEANTRNVLLTSQLQRLTQEQFDLGAPASTASRVIRTAQRATAPSGWGPAVYLSAAVGVVLVVLALAGVGLVLSRRVFGETRWARITGGNGVTRAVRLRWRNNAQRRRTIRSTSLLLRSAVGSDGPVRVAFLPERTRRAEQRVSPLLNALEDEGLELEHVASVVDALTSGRSLLVVEVGACRVDDAAVLSDAPGSTHARIVPVLV